MIYLFALLVGFTFAEEYQTTLIGDDKFFVYTTNDPRPIKLYTGPLLEVPFSFICYKYPYSLSGNSLGHEKACVVVNEKNCKLVKSTLDRNLADGISRSEAIKSMFANSHHPQDLNGILFRSEKDQRPLMVMPEQYEPHLAKAGQLLREKNPNASAFNSTLTSKYRFNGLPDDKKEHETNLVRPMFFDACKSYGIDLEKAYYRAPAEVKMEAGKKYITDKETSSTPNSTLPTESSKKLNSRPQKTPAAR